MYSVFVFGQKHGIAGEQVEVCLLVFNVNNLFRSLSHMTYSVPEADWLGRRVSDRHLSLLKIGQVYTHGHCKIFRKRF